MKYANNYYNNVLHFFAPYFLYDNYYSKTTSTMARSLSSPLIFVATTAVILSLLSACGAEWRGDLNKIYDFLIGQRTLFGNNFVKEYRN